MTVFVSVALRWVMWGDVVYTATDNNEKNQKKKMKKKKKKSVWV